MPIISIQIGKIIGSIYTLVIANIMDQDEKKKINWTKWFALSAGGLLGLSHIGMIGMIARRSDIPVIQPPVGPYTSYVVSADKEGYKMSYVGNDPKTMYKTTKVKEKGGFLGLSNETKEITEEYTMDGDVHIQKEWQVKGGVGDSIASNKSEACIEAIGGGKQTGKVVGASVGAAVANTGISSIPFVGWVLAGAATMIGMDQGAEIGGNMAEDLNKNC